MEKSEAQEKIINLGKLFVKELELETDNDTLSRWMAYYLAEKISIAEQFEGEKKEATEKECFGLILKLWQHRHCLPSGRRPLQSFEPIIDTLSRLSPDREEAYFFEAMRNQNLSELEKENLEFKSVEEWTTIATEIDKTARILIEYALSQAANYAKNDKTKEWIENAINLSDNSDASIINILLDNNPSFDIKEYDKDDFSKNYKVEKFKRRISQLQKYRHVNEEILKAYETELKKYSDE